MSGFEDLKNALNSLRSSVTNFPIGAVSLDDFKPIEEKIWDTRKTLKRLNARLLILRAQKEFLESKDSPKEDIKKTFSDLQNTTANVLLDDIAIKQCLHSHSVQAVLNGKEGDGDMQKKMYSYILKLFSLNDSILAMQEKIEDGLQKQLKLKIECQKELFHYKRFLQEQEEIRKKKLEETNPELAKVKEKTNKAIQNINIMKKIIINFICASCHLLEKEELLFKLLEKHRDSITMETITKMTSDSSES